MIASDEVITWAGESDLTGLTGPVSELGTISIQLEASTDQPSPATVSFSVISGVIPGGCSLSGNGLLSGTITDMDLWVPEFAGSKPPIQQDGSTYATYGSALAKVHTITFTVRATGVENFADKTFTMTILNNFSSDRDQMIRDYSDAFGVDGKMFPINGTPVTAEEYLTYQKSLGYFI
jgi:hypothetical protein